MSEEIRGLNDEFTTIKQIHDRQGTPVEVKEHLSQPKDHLITKSPHLKKQKTLGSSVKVMFEKIEEEKEEDE